nr:DNA-directed RNA polymerase II subunit 4-like [Setaria viridis]
MSGEEENAAELKIGEGSLSFTSPIEEEVAIILEHKYEQIQQHVSESDPSSQVSQVFEKSLQYVKRFSRYKNPDAVRQVCKTLRRYGLAEFELCTLGNLCQDTRGETTALVPSLKSGGRFVGKAGNEKIEKMLTDLSLIKKFE